MRQKVISGIFVALTLSLISPSRQSDAQTATTGWPLSGIMQIEQLAVGQESSAQYSVQDIDEQYHYQGNERARRGDYRGAISCYDQALKLNATNLGALWDRAVCKLLSGEHAGAIADCSAAIVVNAEFADAYYLRSICYAEHGNTNDALPDALKAARLCDNKKDIEGYRRALSAASEIYIERGRLLAYDQNYSGALACFDMALQLNSDSCESLCNRGAVKALMHNYDGAFADLNLAIQKLPWYATAYVERARVNLDAGKYEPGIKDAGEAIRLNPKDVSAYLTRAVCFQRIGNKVAAVRDLDVVVNLYQAENNFDGVEEARSLRAELS